MNNFVMSNQTFDIIKNSSGEIQKEIKDVDSIVGHYGSFTGMDVYIDNDLKENEIRVVADEHIKAYMEHVANRNSK
jgi:hypothetical protein